MSFYELALCAEFLRDWRAFHEGTSDRVMYDRAFNTARTDWLRKYQSERLRIAKYNRWVEAVNK